MHETTKLNIEKMNEKYHIAKINDNAYKLELPPEFGVSLIFNISDLRPYLGEEDEMPSRKMSMQEGRMMRTTILRLQSFVPLGYLALSHDHEHNN
jgi:hypothetical protein